MKQARELSVILAVAFFLAALLVSGERPRANAALPAPQTLAELDARAERRHQELLIKIETLRRQAVALLGNRRIQ